MADVAVMLGIAGWRVVVVGGGATAVRRATMLVEAGAEVTVIAPRIDDRLRTVAGVTLVERPFEPGDVAGARLVVVATDDPAVNDAAMAAAREAGALVNRADAPELGDVQFAATRRAGPVTLAVHSGGTSAAAAGQIADQLLAALGEDWPVLLEVAGTWRAVIQERFPPGEARRGRLRKLAGSTAMRVLKERGRAGLEAYCQRLADPDADPT